MLALTLLVTIGAAAAVARVLSASNHERELTGQQVATAFARQHVPVDLIANPTKARLIAGPHVVALLDDTRDLIGNGSLESGLSGTVLDSSRTASAYQRSPASGWLRLQKRNLVVEVTTTAPKLETEAIAAVRSLK